VTVRAVIRGAFLALYLLAPAAFADTEPARGMLLVASPSIQDPNFRETVILLGDVNPRKVSSGIILNRPTGKKLSEFVPELAASGAAKHEVYVGGPVEPERLILLHRSTKTVETKAAKLLDDVVIAWGHETLERLLAEKTEAKDLRLYAGYAMWVGEQLQGEIARGAWRILPATAKHVFRADVETLWRELSPVRARAE